MPCIFSLVFLIFSLFPQDYAGSDACAQCHDNVGTFMESKMARTSRDGAECSSCHSSRISNLNEPGVACERCHGPAGKHVSANGAAKVIRPSSEATCLQCHLKKEEAHAAGLAQSKCKQASGEGLWCRTCHDPHRTVPASEVASHYRAKCRTCHQLTHREVANREDCVTCHMPSRKEAPMHTARTDHRIRKL